MSFSVGRDEADPIDAVITWVDGYLASHRASREQHMAALDRPLNENAANPHRWNSSDEILYCLWSIHTYAPWIRKIWIVTDGNRPDVSSLPLDLRSKIHYSDHDQIFDGFKAVLPTFNSLAIESVLWRIGGLSNRFLYFNDDVFLTAPLRPEDVFRANNPVLRGGWTDLSALENTPAAVDDPALFHHFVQINAARLAGEDPSHLFASAHVVHPLRRDVMADLWDRHAQAFRQNISHKFRDIVQFLPQGLHNMACLALGEAEVQSRKDHLHIYSGQGIGEASSEMRAVLRTALTPMIRFLCVNDLGQLEQVVPDARDVIAKATGAPR